MNYKDLSIFENKSVLVTGGAGFIGSNIVRHLKQYTKNCEIYIFDIFRNDENSSSLGHFENIKLYNVNIVHGDLSDSGTLKELFQLNFDFIFHQGAISDTTAINQSLVIKTNLNSFYHFLEYARNKNIPMVYASSAAVYGDLPSPQKVGNENPINIYGFTKVAMDRLAIKEINKNVNRPALIGLRYFNVYGMGEFFKGKTSSVCLQIAKKLLNNESPLLFEGSEDIYRDFVYIEDIIQAIFLSIISKKSGVYNIGSGIKRSFKDVYIEVSKSLGKNINPIYIKNPYNSYQNDTCADIIDAKEIFRYSPNFTLENGIKSYCNEIIKNIHLIKKYN